MIAPSLIYWMDNKSYIEHIVGNNLTFTLVKSGLTLKYKNEGQPSPLKLVFGVESDLLHYLF